MMMEEMGAKLIAVLQSFRVVATVSSKGHNRVSPFVPTPEPETSLFQ
jgi:hypothetical protein